MIELLDGVILAKDAPKEACSFSFEKGSVNFIDYNDKYKFNFLALKNQSLDSGTFKIDEHQIYPNENNDYSLFFMAVNSLVRFNLCFVVETKQKKEKVKAVQDALVTLRDLPTETDEDKQNKIVSIFDCVSKLQPSYLLLDFNDSVNTNRVFIEQQLQKHAADVLIIVLSEKAVIEESKEEETPFFEEDSYEINIGGDKKPIVKTTTQKTSKQPKKEKVKAGDSFGKTFAGMFKENYMVFLSFIAPALGVIAFTLLSPLYAQTNKVLLIPFIITICICFILFMIMTYKCAVFENKKQLIAYSILNTSSILIAFGLSILFYFLFLNFDKEIKELNSKNVTGFLVASIMAVILITACLYVGPIARAIIKLFKKKK